MRYAAMVEAEDEGAGQQENQARDPAPAASPEQNLSETPSFLRRSTSSRFPPPTADNGGGGLSPIASRKPRQFAGRGLSHIVQGLRAMEQEREDDDWDVLREIEEEQEAANIQIPESQNPAPERYRPAKKKGQKRTTRKVNLRPVAPRPKPREEPKPDPIEEDSESDDELAAVPETQFPAGAPDAEGDAPEKNHEDEDVASLHTMSEPDLDSDAPEEDPDNDTEYEDEEEAAKPMSRTKSFSERIKEAVSMSKPKAKEPPVTASKAPEKEEKKNPKPRKVNPETHANYRSLKIRNRPSRGGGRFRRR